jgi:uncharacterized membrane protein YoaK (UPF0700 family)
MDAYSYIVHGGVFATAQTGNVVFFAIYASEGLWGNAFRHVPTVMAFILGVVTANLLGVLPKKHTFRGTLLCQAIEFTTMVALALFAGFLPDEFTVPILSFIAALQNTSFGAFGPWVFNSAITTGNIQNATTGATQWAMGREVAINRGKFLVSFSMSCSFFIGALFGAIISTHDAHYSLWPCVGLVLVGFLFTLRERQTNLKRGIPA